MRQLLTAAVSLPDHGISESEKESHLRRTLDLDDVARKFPVIACFFAGLLVIMTQRIVLPISGQQIQMPMIFATLLLAALLLSECITIDIDRLIVLLAFVSVGLATLVIVEIVPRGYIVPSITSLALACTCYVWVTTKTAEGGVRSGLGNSFITGLTCGITVGAVLGVYQYYVQNRGGGFPDPLSAILPTKFLRTGFNTFYSLQYVDGAKGHYKPNGMVFLEPSSLSLYSGLAIVIALSICASRRRSVRVQCLGGIVVLICLAGMAVSWSSSGVVIIALSAIPLLVECIRRRAWSILWFSAICVATFSAAGVFSGVWRKLNEGTASDTSSAKRLTQPYDVLGSVWLDHPLIGWGPGTGTVFLRDSGVSGLQIPTTLKLVTEYGVLGASLLALLLILALVNTEVPLAILVAALTAYLVPSESLLDITIILLLGLGCLHWRVNVKTAISHQDTTTVKDR